MSANKPISPAKKTYQAALWAVNKVSIAKGYAIQKMGGAAAVAAAIWAAATAYAANTVGKAAAWLEDKLAKGIPIVVGFLAAQVGLAELQVLRQILEYLT